MECIYTTAQCTKLKKKSKLNKNINKIQPWFGVECNMVRV